MESAREMELDITESELVFTCKSLYSLRLPLPFPVLSDDGTAKFNRNTRSLSITLPVVQLAPPTHVPFEENKNDADGGEEENQHLVQSGEVTDVARDIAKEHSVEIDADKSIISSVESHVSVANSNQHDEAGPTEGEPAQTVTDPTSPVFDGVLPGTSFRENSDNVTVILRQSGIDRGSLRVSVHAKKILIQYSYSAAKYSRLAIDLENEVLPNRSRCDISDLNLVIILRKGKPLRWENIGSVRAFEDGGDTWSTGVIVFPIQSRVVNMASAGPSSETSSQDRFEAESDSGDGGEERDVEEEGEGDRDENDGEEEVDGEDSDDDKEWGPDPTDTAPETSVSTATHPPPVPLKFTNAVMYELD